MIEALITIDFSFYTNSISDIVRLLTGLKWSPYDKTNKMSYLPAGDDDDFDYAINEISVTKLCEIVDYKQKNSEMVGVRLYHEISDCGVTLLASDTKSVTLSLDYNRVKLQVGNSLTDRKWYVDNIITPVENKLSQTIHYEFVEYDSGGRIVGR